MGTIVKDEIMLEAKDEPIPHMEIELKDIDNAIGFIQYFLLDTWD